MCVCVCVCVCVCLDKPMQMNQALFMLGGGSGYVPHPDVMRDDAFDPFDKDTLRLEPITIQLQVRPTDRISARPPRPYKGMVILMA